MGGGYGISGHGTHIAATPKTKFAMPEVRIGFFPDVGASYNLAKLDNFIGLYLSLTGLTISANDMHYAGLCDVIVDGDKIHRIESEIADELEKNTDADFETQKELVSTVLSKHHIAQEKSFLETNIDHIRGCFSKESVEDIIKALNDNGSEWAKETLALMEFACPFSIKIAFEQFQRAQKLDFGEVIAQDYILASRFIMGHDLYEGIKAAVIDKDKEPFWSPDKFEKISDDDVTNYFLPVNLL
jgi:enoyl-CoA hydratase